MSDVKLKKTLSIRGIMQKQLFLPIFALILMLLFNLLNTPDFFHISIENGVLYG